MLVPATGCSTALLWVTKLAGPSANASGQLLATALELLLAMASGSPSAYWSEAQSVQG